VLRHQDVYAVLVTFAAVGADPGDRVDRVRTGLAAPLGLALLPPLSLFLGLLLDLQLGVLEVNCEKFLEKVVILDFAIDDGLVVRVLLPY
jgi:hypothetical protein